MKKLISVYLLTLATSFAAEKITIDNFPSTQTNRGKKLVEFKQFKSDAAGAGITLEQAADARSKQVSFVEYKKRLASTVKPSPTKTALQKPVVKSPTPQPTTQAPVVTPAPTKTVNTPKTITQPTVVIPTTAKTVTPLKSTPRTLPVTTPPNTVLITTKPKSSATSNIDLFDMVGRFPITSEPFTMFSSSGKTTYKPSAIISTGDTDLVNSLFAGRQTKTVTYKNTVCSFAIEPANFFDGANLTKIRLAQQSLRQTTYSTSSNSSKKSSFGKPHNHTAHTSSKSLEGSLILENVATQQTAKVTLKNK